MAALEFLSEFRDREGEPDILKAKWYIIAAAALTSACAGDQVAGLYSQVTAGLCTENKILVQRRIKEAIVKGSVLYGVPRSAGGLSSLYSVLSDDEIDTFAPRSEKIDTPGDDERRAARGRKYFETLWGPAGAQAQRDRTCKYYPDVYLLNIKTIYELWISEDAILSDIETQMCNTALLICNNSPVPALWHLNGLIRHGATLEQARFAQELGLAIAHKFGAKTGNITKVDDLALVT